MPTTGHGAFRSRLFGVFLLSLALLDSELILTRLFSVTLWYHFAFVAVSVALLGVAAGGLAVYREARTSPEDLPALLARDARRFGMSGLVTLLVLLGVPFIYRISLGAAVSLALIYSAATLPYFFAGSLLARIFRAEAGRIGAVYAADLLGAGVGALLAVPLLNLLPAPSALVLAAAVGAAAALPLAAGAAPATARTERRRSLLTAGGLALLAALGAATPLFRIDFAKDQIERGVLAERWNALARITVTPHGTPTWGISERYRGPRPDSHWMKIDSEAGTPITRWDGDPAKVEALRWDITAFAYGLRPGARALVIGPGGGRDVLTALLMGARSVTGVEINPAIVETVRGTFGDFSGHLYDDPRVTIAVGEGREFLRRSSDRYDVLQASLIDTWAASAAGAYVFSEANLYTREAFGEYLDRLTPEGILTMSRWHFKDLPTETLRIVGLAVRALRDRGVTNPSAHIILVKRTTWDWAYRLSEPRDGIGTLLVKASPFRPDEVAAAREAAAALDFQVLLAPGGGGDPLFERLLASPDPADFAAGYPVDVSPPRDERPFFFYTMRLWDLPKWIAGGESLEQGVMQNNVRAVFVLFALLAVMAVLSVAFLVVPLRPGARGPGAPPPAALAYFASIGLGFILVEIPLIQRSILFLGHPLYALSVVLSGLLVGAGLGSFLAGRLGARATRAALGALLVAVALVAFLSPALLSAARGAPAAARVGVVLAIVAPLGVLMGVPFPHGVRMLGGEGARWVPWMWAINGVFSVLATVLATAIAMTSGFGAALGAGLLAYAAAVALALRGRWDAPGRAGGR